MTESDLRIDLDRNAGESLDLSMLTGFERVLLSTDGTVTDILASWLLEPIELVKLGQSDFTTSRAIENLDTATGTTMMYRQILLRGAKSARNHVYAESLLVPQRLPVAMRRDLEETRQPIGQLMLNNRLETYREVLTCNTRSAGSTAAAFGLEEETPVICRTYRVILGGQPIMLISEQFPFNHFPAR